MPQELVERLSALMVEARKSHRVQKLLETYGIDESAQDHIAFKKLYDNEVPIWIDAVKGIGLTLNNMPARRCHQSPCDLCWPALHSSAFGPVLAMVKAVLRMTAPGTNFS